MAKSETQKMKDAIHDEFSRKDGLREQLLSDFKDHFDAEIGRFTRKQMFAIAAVVISGMGAWFSLYYQVQGNSDFLKEGDRFTQQDGKILQIQIDQNKATIVDSVTRIESSLKRIEDILID